MPARIVLIKSALAIEAAFPLVTALLLALATMVD